MPERPFMQTCTKGTEISWSHYREECDGAVVAQSFGRLHFEGVYVNSAIIQSQLSNCLQDLIKRLYKKCV